MTLSRRTFIGLTTAVTAGAALPATAGHASTEQPEVAAAVPWPNYFGAVRVSPQQWGRFRRDGFVYTDDGQLDSALLAERLATHHVLLGGRIGIGLHSTQEEVDALMDGIAADNGAAYRAGIRTNIADAIEVQQGTTHRLLAVQVGNEINSASYYNTLSTWATSRGKDFPHPNTDFGDGDGAHSRDYIGYLVEYVLAPAIEAVNDANAAAPMEYRLEIMCGSLAGARHPRARTTWLPALLDYVIDGEFAPTLAGRRVADLVDYLAIHYLLTADPISADPEDAWRPALDDLHATWVGTGRIAGIWHTEEGGGQAQDLGQHASVSQRVFARITDWRLDRGAPPDVVRVAGFIEGENPPETSWNLGMETLLGFLGPDSILLNRSGGVSAQVDNDVETYGFETGNHTRRVLFVTPVRKGTSTQGPTTVTAVTMQATGWTAPGNTINATAHLFRTVDNGYEFFDVNVDGAGPYTINLPAPIDLNADNGGATLAIHLTNQ